MNDSFVSCNREKMEMIHENRGNSSVEIAVKR